MDYSYLKDWKKRAYEKTGGRGKSLSFMFDVPTKGREMNYDLHIHDRHSDGARNPEKVFAEASEHKLDVISITNHDNIKSEEEYHNYTTNTGKYKGGFINGVEITCRLNGYPVEVNLYDFNLTKAQSLIADGTFPYLDRDFRKRRILTLIQKRIYMANAMGITDKKLTLNDFISVEIPNDVGEPRYVPFSKLGLDAVKDMDIGKRKLKETVTLDGKEYKINFDYLNSKLFKYIVQSENAKEMLKKYDIDVPEYVAKQADVESSAMPNMLKQSFEKFNRGMIQAHDAPFYLDDSEYWPTVQQICDFAKKTDGVAIYNHPYVHSRFSKSPLELLNMAIEAGVDGVEVWHGFNNAEQVHTLYKIARENGLLITSGSDTHDWYSYQGNETTIGYAPGVGDFNNDGTNPISELSFNTYNLHYIGSGAYEKDFKNAQENQMQ